MRCWARSVSGLGAGLRGSGSVTWVTPPANLQNVGGMGIGTNSDSVNRLSVQAPATLLSHDGGDHRIVVGRVEEVRVDRTKAPLVYFQSSYRGLSEQG